MKVSKICMICNQNLGKYSCRFCGKLVCSNDYDSSKGICINCKQGSFV